jgi:hypothetical protein
MLNVTKTVTSNNFVAIDPNEPGTVYIIKQAGFISFVRTVPNTVSSHGVDSTESV